MKRKKMPGISATVAACTMALGLTAVSQSVNAQSSLVARDPGTIKYGWQDSQYVKQSDLSSLKTSLDTLEPSFMKTKAMCTLDLAQNSYRHARTTGTTEFYAATAYRYGQIAASKGPNVLVTPVAPGAPRGYESQRAELLKAIAQFDPDCPPPEFGCAEVMLEGAEFEMATPGHSGHAQEYLDAFNALLAKGKASTAMCKAPAPIPVAPAKTYTVSADALFKFDKSGINDMTNNGRHMLEELATKVNADFTSVKTLTVVGHTDRLGSEAYNQVLSQARANTGKNFLRNLIKAESYQAVGRGKSEPVTGDKCSAKMSRKALIDCLQPDRRIKVRVDGMTVNAHDVPQAQPAGEQ